jgi:hypothetical protein
MATFQLFFQSGQANDLSAPLYINVIFCAHQSLHYWVKEKEIQLLFVIIFKLIILFGAVIVIARPGVQKPRYATACPLF